jgi:hypothetical protein
MVKLSSPVTLLALSLGFSSVPAQAYPVPDAHCTLLTVSPLKVKKVGKVAFEPKDVDYRRDETAPMRLAAGMVEDAVVIEVRRILQTPEVVT